MPPLQGDPVVELLSQREVRAFMAAWDLLVKQETWRSMNVIRASPPIIFNSVRAKKADIEDKSKVCNFTLSSYCMILVGGAGVHMYVCFVCSVR